ncbi:hypothetical protein OHR68_33620 [Spirillospora sp. NBC_00431]
MGKAGRNRDRRRGDGGHRPDAGAQPTSRRRVVVDQLEIGQCAGMLTMRMGRDEEQPVRLVIPAAHATSMVRGLGEARLDAEETYWKQIAPWIRARRLHRDEPTSAVRVRLQAMLLEQNWDTVIAAVPGGGRGLFLITHAGHVGLCAEPPHTSERVLAIIDPVQLHRLSGSLRDALAQARADDRKLAHRPVRSRLTQVRRYLESEPWPSPPPGYFAPTPQQAETEMTRRYREFLTRTPYHRPPEHDSSTVQTGD